MIISATNLSNLMKKPKIFLIYLFHNFFFITSTLILFIMYLLQNQNKCEKQPKMSLIVQLLSEETFNRFKRISQSWVECKLDLYLLDREREREEEGSNSASLPSFN